MPNVLVEPWTPTRQPPYQSVINGEDAFSRGLLGLWVPQGSRTVQNLAAPGRSPLTWTGHAWKSSPTGPAISCSGSSAASTTLNLSGLAGITIALHLDLTGSLSSTMVLLEHSANYNSASGGWIIYADVGQLNAGWHNANYSNAAYTPATGMPLITVTIQDTNGVVNNVVTLYEDGAQKAQGSASGAFALINDTMYMGARGGSSLGWDKRIGSLWLWNRVLSAGEIAAHAERPFRMVTLPASYAPVGWKPSGAASQSLNANSVTLTLTPQPATLTVGSVSLAANAASLTLTPQGATLTKGAVTLAAMAAALTLTPQPATLTKGAVNLAASPATVTLTPQPATLTVGAVSITANVATLTLTPQSASLSTGAGGAQSIDAGMVTLVLTPQAASLTPGTVSLAAAATTLTLSAQPATLTAVTALSAGVVGLALSPQPAGLSLGAATIAAGVVTLTVSVLPASLQGQIPDLRYPTSVTLATTGATSLTLRDGGTRATLTSGQTSVEV